MKKEHEEGTGRNMKEEEKRKEADDEEEEQRGMMKDMKRWRCGEAREKK